MNLLQKYIFRQALRPLLIILSSLAGLALLTQSLSTLDLIVENRQSAGTFLYITVLALPQLIAVILPLAVFMAALYALNRLNIDSELVVTKSVGTGPWSLSSPLIRLATFALILHLLINLLLQPLAFREMRQKLVDIRTDLASQLVVAGQFVTPVPNLTVYAREILPNGQMADVMIRDARGGDENARTYTSKTGIISRQSQSAILTLDDGTIQQLEENGRLNPITFESYQIDLSSILTIDSNFRLKSDDRFLHELVRPDPREFLDRKTKRNLLSDGHSRLATPLYNIALVLLALAFLIRGEFQKMGYGRRIAFCASLGFLIRLSGFGIQAAASGDPAYNILQYLFPAFVIILCAIYLSQKKRANRLFRLPRKKASSKHFVAT